MQEISALLDSYTPSENEAQVEEDLVRPILRLLGHTFEVQPALTTPEGTKRPDYVLYDDASSVAANKGKTLTDELLKNLAFAVADARYWARPVHSARKDAATDPLRSRHASQEAQPEVDGLVESGLSDVPGRGQEGFQTGHSPGRAR